MLSCGLMVKELEDVLNYKFLVSKYRSFDTSLFEHEALEKTPDEACPNGD